MILTIRLTKHLFCLDVITDKFIIEKISDNEFTSRANKVSDMIDRKFRQKIDR